MGEPPSPEILRPRKATHPSQIRGGGREQRAKDLGRPGACKGVVGSGGRGVSQPPLAVWEHPNALPTPLRWENCGNPPPAPSPREVLGCYPSSPNAASTPAPRPGPEGRGVSGLVGREAGSPRLRAPTQRVEPEASPRSADWQLEGGVAVTGVPVSGVPTAPVKCSALPLP